MSPKDLRQLEKQITTLSDALARLGRGTTLADLLKIIRKPGWTTPAELAFLRTGLNAMQNQVAAIGKLQDELVAASKQVG